MKAYFHRGPYTAPDNAVEICFDLSSVNTWIYLMGQRSDAVHDDHVFSTTLAVRVADIKTFCVRDFVLQSCS